MSCDYSVSIVLTVSTARINVTNNSANKLSLPNKSSYFSEFSPQNYSGEIFNFGKLLLCVRLILVHQRSAGRVDRELFTNYIYFKTLSTFRSFEWNKVGKEELKTLLPPFCGHSFCPSHTLVVFHTQAPNWNIHHSPQPRRTD